MLRLCTQIVNEAMRWSKIIPQPNSSWNSQKQCAWLELGQQLSQDKPYLTHCARPDFFLKVKNQRRGLFCFLFFFKYFLYWGDITNYQPQLSPEARTPTLGYGQQWKIKRCPGKLLTLTQCPVCVHGHIIHLANLSYQFLFLVKASTVLNYTNENEINAIHLVINFSPLKGSAPQQA